MAHLYLMKEYLDSLALYNKYLNDIKRIENLYLCGRLAEYKYYNMNAVIEAALNLYERIGENNEKK